MEIPPSGAWPLFERIQGVWLAETVVVIASCAIATEMAPAARKASYLCQVHLNAPSEWPI
jgi:hypothetical protein